MKRGGLYVLAHKDKSLLQVFAFPLVYMLANNGL